MTAELMLQLAPIYGWGWRDQQGSVDEPAPFAIEVEQVAEGSPPSAALGRVASSSHPLHGRWIVMTRRTEDGRDYNVYVFGERPGATDFAAMIKQPADMTGFADLV